MTTILGEIIDILVGGLSSMGQGIGSGLNTMVTSLFITTTEGVSHLSTLSITFFSLCFLIRNLIKRQIPNKIRPITIPVNIQAKKFCTITNHPFYQYCILVNL